EIPTDRLLRVERDGATLVVIRLSEGVFAYHDRCPHAYWPLSQGTLNNGVLECPGHGWEFDVETGRCLNAAAYCLIPIGVMREGDSVGLAWDGESAEAKSWACERADLSAGS